jgi:exopolysaccharide production protein ExoQ
MSAHRSLALWDTPHASATIGQPLAASVGFYYSVRLLLPLLAVRMFHQDPQDGVAASLALNYLFLVLALFATAGNAPRTFRFILHLPFVRLVLCFIGFAGISLLWSVTASVSAAVAFWCAMAADTAIVLLLLRDGPIEQVTASLMRGYVWGSCAIALVAWILPAQSDLRLGDEELLGPNQIGWICAFAFFLAQYLMRSRKGNWTPHALFLAITLLRSLSKTSIIAFLAGEGYVLLRDREMSRKAKLLLIASAALVLVVFSGLVAHYYAIYQNAGNQSETLTGRLGIWLFIGSESLQRPWIGHGFHSMWKVIPPFGEFEARHAHNELLQQFYAYGAAGVVLLIALYGSVWRRLRRAVDSPIKVLFMGMLLLVLVRGLADTEVFDLSLPLWFIVIIGALLEQSGSRGLS